MSRILKTDLILEELDNKKNEYKRMDKSTKNALNKRLNKWTYNTYFKGIPFEELKDLLNEFNMVILQEDGTLWSGFFAGDKGRANFDLANVYSENEGFYTPFENTALSFSWYRMPSGNYEIVAYLT